MSRLIIKNSGETIYNGENCHNVTSDMTASEARKTILQSHYDKGWEFDYYMDDFRELDDCVDAGNDSSIEIIVE